MLLGLRKLQSRKQKDVAPWDSELFGAFRVPRVALAEDPHAGTWFHEASCEDEGFLGALVGRYHGPSQKIFLDR